MAHLGADVVHSPARDARCDARAEWTRHSRHWMNTDTAPPPDDSNLQRSSGEPPAWRAGAAVLRSTGISRKRVEGYIILILHWIILYLSNPPKSPPRTLPVPEAAHESQQSIQTDPLHPDNNYHLHFTVNDMFCYAYARNRVTRSHVVSKLLVDRKGWCWGIALFTKVVCQMGNVLRYSTHWTHIIPTSRTPQRSPHFFIKLFTNFNLYFCISLNMYFRHLKLH